MQPENEATPHCPVHKVEMVGATQYTGLGNASQEQRIWICPKCEEAKNLKQPTYDPLTYR
jgi:rubrerythrin